MNTTAARIAALTTIGTAVEVEVTDFSPAGFAAGFPKIWVRGEVTAAAPIGNQGHVDVMVRTELGTFAPCIIGRRGGNRTIRLAA